MEIGFAEALLVVGAVLALASGLSGWLHGTVLSISVLSLGAGVGLSIAGILTVDPATELVLIVVELALLLTLFADGLLVEDQLLRTEWRAPVRALVVAMPITLTLIACTGKLLFSELSWPEAFLLGAVLSPTDPVITSAVVSSKRIPAAIRHTLNLESGLNDGLALPFVLFFLVLATSAGSAGIEALQLVGETGLGVLVGGGVALVGAVLLPRLPGGGLRHKYEGVYALGIALAAFGLAEIAWGNGLIAVFVTGIVLALTRHDIPASFGEFNESVSATFQVITFVLFGALIVDTGWDGSLARLVLFIVVALVVARPAAVLLSFLGISMPFAHKLFIAWFGPKGVASMLFALLVLSSGLADRTLVFDIASYTILASILAHGLTDTIGSNWLDRKLDSDGSLP